MTNKEIEVQKALGTYLPAKWGEREKLHTEADKLHAEGSKLFTEDDKLYAEGDKLWAEGRKLRVKGDELYIDAVMEIYGPKAIIDWEDGSVKNE